MEDVIKEPTISEQPGESTENESGKKQIIEKTIRLQGSSSDGVFIEMLPNGNVSQKRFTIPEKSKTLINFTDNLNTENNPNQAWVRLFTPTV